MAETTLKLGDGTPEEIAYKLFRHIATVEDKQLVPVMGGRWDAAQKADRDWILSTYAECLDTVNNPSARLK